MACRGTALLYFIEDQSGLRCVQNWEELGIPMGTNTSRISFVAKISATGTFYVPTRRPDFAVSSDATSLPLWLTSSSKKLKQSLYTPWRRLGGQEVQLLLIFDLGTRWGWAVSVMPRPRFTPGQRTPGTHCTGGWVGPRAGLDTEDRGKIFSPLPGIERRSPGRLARRQTLY
jgi:hypothetical protein